MKKKLNSRMDKGIWKAKTWVRVEEIQVLLENVGLSGEELNVIS
jgi:hypothetical protein